MIGTGLPEDAGRAVMNGVHDMGGMDGFGKVEPEPNEPMFHTEWEGRVLAMVRAMGAAGAFNIDTLALLRARRCRPRSISPAPTTRNGCSASRSTC